MPWNNQGGGWQGGGGGQGPWGGRPGGGGGGQQPPDLEELLRRSQEKVKKIFPGGGGPGGGGFSLGGGGSRWPLFVIPLVLVGLWFASGFYTIAQEEQGVVLRFGKQVAIKDPGLHWRWPSPIETVEKEKVTIVNRVEVGFRSAASGNSRSASASDISNESLMLTGDENIVDINFTVQWVIDNAANFLFNVRDPRTTVKAVSESVVREIIGKTPFAEATTEKRADIEQAAAEQIQEILNNYGAGILVREVQVQKVDPPDQVIDAFRDVQRAQADRERAQNEAEAYQNDILPRARGDAVKMEQEAEAYAQEVVAAAEGESQRFLAVYDEFKLAKDVTTRRIYIDTMAEVLGNMNKVLIDGSASGQGGVVPYLPLPELERRAKQRQNNLGDSGDRQ